MDNNIVITDFRQVPTVKGSGIPLRVGLDLLNMNFNDLEVILYDLANDKVSKIPNKGLSTNDYSDIDKARVMGLPGQVESVSGSQAKANSAEMNSKLYTDDLIITKQDKLTPVDGSINIDENNNISVVLNVDLANHFTNQINF